MTIRLEPVKIEAYDDELEQHAFTVECFDECTAVVTLFQKCHNGDSWQEISAAIATALERLELK
jgi:uncharacterized protein YigE (DUF2233 family)